MYDRNYYISEIFVHQIFMFLISFKVVIYVNFDKLQKRMKFLFADTFLLIIKMCL